MIRIPLRAIPQEVPRSILSGPLRGAFWIPGSSTHGCWLGVYERKTQRAFSCLVRSGDVVFDIGANVGFFTLLSARLSGPGGSVVAFEPFPRNLVYLRRHIDLNHLTNVTVVEAAVSDVCGTGFLGGEASNPSALALTQKGLPVSLVTIDEMVAYRGLPRPQLLKIDVEGAESAVLRGAVSVLSSCRPAVILSCHGWQQHDFCTRFLQGLDYRITEQRDGADDGNYEVFALAE